MPPPTRNNQKVMKISIQSESGTTEIDSQSRTAQLSTKKCFVTLHGNEVEQIAGMRMKLPWLEATAELFCSISSSYGVAECRINSLKILRVHQAALFISRACLQPELRRKLLECLHRWCCCFLCLARWVIAISRVVLCLRRNFFHLISAFTLSRERSDSERLKLSINLVGISMNFSFDNLCNCWNFFSVHKGLLIARSYLPRGRTETRKF